MMFKSRFHRGIKDGSITCTFRYWKRPQAVAGNFYKINPIGHIKVTEVKEVSSRSITKKDAVASGFEDGKALREYLANFASKDRELYLVRFTYEGLRQDQLPDQSSVDDPEEFLKLKNKLAVRDKNSKVGPWTHKTLKLVGKNPGMSSEFLAKKLKRDRQELKRDMRKLKQLGLTISLEVGYKLSPRGSSYLEQLSS